MSRSVGQLAIIGQALGFSDPAHKYLQASSPLIVTVNWEAGVKGREV